MMLELGNLSPEERGAPSQRVEISRTRARDFHAIRPRVTKFIKSLIQGPSSREYRDHNTLMLGLSSYLARNHQVTGPELIKPRCWGSRSQKSTDHRPHAQGSSSHKAKDHKTTKSGIIRHMTRDTSGLIARDHLATRPWIVSPQAQGSLGHISGDHRHQAKDYHAMRLKIIQPRGKGHQLAKSWNKNNKDYDSICTYI